MTPKTAFALDHVVLASASLEDGTAWLEQRLGVVLAAGGSHAGWGTHNRLLRLGEDTYLELIAPDPAQHRVSRPRLFGLDDPGLRRRISVRPRLIHYVLRTPDLDEARATLAYDPGAIESMSRAALRWRITVPGDGVRAHGGVLPTIIDWGVTPHPCTALPDQAVALEALRVMAPTQILEQIPPVGDDARLQRMAQERERLELRLRVAGASVILD